MLELKWFPQWSRRTWILLGLATCYFVWLSGVFGNAGILQAYQLSEARYELSMRIKALENENQRVKTTIDLLQHSRMAQEIAIRETIGFIRENELTFEFR